MASDKSPKQAQQFLSVHDRVQTIFHPRRHTHSAAAMNANDLTRPLQSLQPSVVQPLLVGVSPITKPSNPIHTAAIRCRQSARDVDMESLRSHHIKRTLLWTQLRNANERLANKRKTADSDSLRPNRSTQFKAVAGAIEYRATFTRPVDPDQAGSCECYNSLGLVA